MELTKVDGRGQTRNFTREPQEMYLPTRKVPIAVRTHVAAAPVISGNVTTLGMLMDRALERMDRRLGREPAVRKRKAVAPEAGTTEL